MALGVGGSGGYQNTSIPVSTYPLIMGGWCIATTLPGTNLIASAISCGQSSVARNHMVVGIVDNGGTKFAAIHTDNGTSFETLHTLGSLTVAANQWVYVIGRFISATNRRMSAFSNTGIGSNSSVTNITLASLNRFTLGQEADSTTNGIVGGVAEAWFADTDIYDSAADLPNDLIFQLALYGPLSIPSVANKLIDYQSLKSSNDSIGKQTAVGSFFRSKYGEQQWSLAGTGQSNFAHVYLPNRIQTSLLTNPALNALKRQNSFGGAGSPFFRKSLSPLGTRVGSRQIQGYMNG